MIFYLRFILFISTFSVAQIGGSYSFSFLNLESSPRINSLGGYSPILIDDDPNLALFNPALINSSMNSLVSLNYVNYYSDINYGSIVYKPIISSNFHFLSGIRYVDYGFFEETDEFGNIIGQFNASEYLFSLGSSKVLFKDNHHLLSFGISTKFALSHLYTDFSLAYLMDISLLYVNYKSRIHSSILVRNIGYQLVKYRDGNSENLPFDSVKAEMSFTLKPNEYVKVLKEVERIKLGGEVEPELIKIDPTFNVQVGEVSMNFIMEEKD